MYVLGNLPADCPPWLALELRKLQESSTTKRDFIVLNTLYSEPSKRVDGMVVKADGTTWNPGSGSGAYIYRDGAWHLLG